MNDTVQDSREEAVNALKGANVNVKFRRAHGKRHNYRCRSGCPFSGSIYEVPQGFKYAISRDHVVNCESNFTGIHPIYHEAIRLKALCSPSAIVAHLVKLQQPEKVPEPEQVRQLIARKKWRDTSVHAYCVGNAYVDSYSMTDDFSYVLLFSAKIAELARTYGRCLLIDTTFYNFASVIVCSFCVYRRREKSRAFCYLVHSDHETARSYQIVFDFLTKNQCVEIPWL